MDIHERDNLLIIIGKLLHCCEVLLESVDVEDYDHLRSIYVEMAHQVNETLEIKNEIH